MRNNRASVLSESDATACNGLLNRRLFLSAGTAAATLGGALPSKAEGLLIEPWMNPVRTSVIRIVPLPAVPV